MSRPTLPLRLSGESARSGCRMYGPRELAAKPRSSWGFQGSEEMKYMIMTFGSAEAGLKAMGKDWMLEMIQFMRTLDEDLRKSGELVSAEGLADGSQAKTVRFQSGIPVATDGPFAESKESLVGYWIVDVVKVPIEVRRVMDAPPEF